MITVVRGDLTLELRGLSTDTKPIGPSLGNNLILGNGSVFLEMDTGKVFLYDASKKAWWELQ